MSAFYDRMRGVAQRLISKYGQAVTLGRISSDPANPLKPWEGQAARITTPIDAIGVFVPVSGNFSMSESISDLHKQYSKFLIAFSENSDIINADVLIEGNKTYGIVALDELNPAGTNMFYFFGMKR